MQLHNRGSVAVVWSLVLSGGAVLGLAARLTDETLPRWVGNVGAVWVLAGFLAGRWSHPKIHGAVAGGSSLTVATIAYYTWRLGIDGTISYGYLRRVGLIWLVAALSVGAVSGWFGRASRENRGWWSVAIGAFFGEATAVLVLSQRSSQVLLELGIGILLVFGSRASIRQLFAPATFAAAIAFVLAFTHRVLLS